MTFCKFMVGLMLLCIPLSLQAKLKSPLRFGSRESRASSSVSLPIERETTMKAKQASRPNQLEKPSSSHRQQNASTLPPMAPTVSRYPPENRSGLTKQNRTGSSTSPLSSSVETPEQIRAQGAPADAAPLRPTPPLPAPEPQLPKRQSLPAARRAQSLQTPGRPGQQEVSPTQLSRSTASASSLSSTATSSQPKPSPASTSADRTVIGSRAGNQLAGVDASNQEARGSLPSPSGRLAALPPGPLTNFPLRITTTPNEVHITGLGSSSAPWSIVLLLTILSLIPSLLICVTPFARLLVVFHFLRQALGLQTTPSNQTLIGLTLILTFFIMEPVGSRIYRESIVPLEAGIITPFEAISRGREPMRDFMVHFVREKDAALFLEIAKEPKPHNVRDLSMRVLLPAYILSELKAGFQIGAVLFLPFLVVDMVVASITTSVGMMQLPPVVISTPLKLLLFLMVDGWHLLIAALVRSFN